ncbi:pseudaminic acid synthase [Lachnoclostridium sp. Marseille-P6806]|uniref:pseudaminic acid synthase n=1 Tax=Lachnoclostridium sp. Marseille-P6806 TaxID=2364793 RepID=UPI0010316D89|nr:pseudaminic acid synthase [Lachnoclostridium sp. Marseille-P6806]
MTLSKAPRRQICIGSHHIGKDDPVYIVAEMSANHLQSYDRALEILRAAKEAGADAIKLQTYTADTITLDSDEPCFRITGGTLWDGTTLHRLYEEAYTPWEWQPKLCEEAAALGLDCFSSPFDPTAVRFMEDMNMPAYKIASYEITDIPLIREIAQKGKPVIFATGVATADDIRLALETCLAEGNDRLVLLKCVSAYPTPYEDMNLNMIPTLAKEYGVITGLSDHSPGSAAAVAAVALGARMVEKHLTLRRADGGPDGAFSMEPEEFARMAADIRIVEKALGLSDYALTPQQEAERSGVRSLFVVADIRAGEALTTDNIRSIRPGDGLPPKELGRVLGRVAARDLFRGKPLQEGDFL